MEFPCRAFLCACGGRYSPPPHAWGILPYLASRYVRGRFIPTCVGNTLKNSKRNLKKAVHPHVRGEYNSNKPFCYFNGGSSPRAWGILTVALNKNRDGRFIPTCVGNTPTPSTTGAQRTVHPHVRGEYPAPGHDDSTHTGSSPRAWGIRRSCSYQGEQCRFIPTCVGNTGNMQAQLLAGSVHPHVRGEYCQVISPSHFSAGSSPRAWGIPLHTNAHRAHPRFIPTCVGNTQKAGSPRPSFTVHPHVRGEYSFMLPAEQSMHGSSPRAWGIPTSDRLQPSKQRFIPTCVGNTRAAFFYSLKTYGSSPRAWGIRRCT